MVRTIRKIMIGISFIASFALSGCIKEQIQQESDLNEDFTLRITASLPDADPDTRLDYYESGKALKAYWSSDDQISASFRPGAADCTFILNLVEGAGTSTGVFETTDKVYGLTPGSIPSNAWTLYFPGNLIKCEEDYLNFSYMGQVQKGSGNTDHLKNYHTIRHMCTDGSNGAISSFKDAFIDFSGEDNNESSCMKIKLADLPSITPVNVALEYTAPSGSESKVFYLHNFLSSYWSGNYEANSSKSHKISIDLEDFGPSTDATVYLMMSNYPVELEAGGKLTISVKSDDDKLYTCTRTLKSDVTLQGGCLHSISGSSWDVAEVYDYDGLENPEEGIFVLQEASAGDGVDIIIMGDGFSNSHFGENGNYDKVMRQAYEDFFSIEPYASMKDYFNVYYINAVSVDDHDAVPQMNGAIQGTANTVFSTEFTPGSTSIRGDDDLVKDYAKQVIRYKGGSGGTVCNDEDEVDNRVNESLMMVMINVDCYAGTCSITYSPNSGNDYCPYSSVAYTSLCTSDELRRLTVIHEAGGHGFGKLADEYGGYIYQTSNSAEAIKKEVNQMDMLHTFGLFRNVNKHWGDEEKEQGWDIQDFEDTSEENVYWAELFNFDYSHEGLGIYLGAYTFDHFYCRATDNSIMRNQFIENGQFFNAISRWAIWYRLLRLAGESPASDFKSSLDEFISFDSSLDISQTTAVQTRSCNTDGLLPLAPPVLIAVE